jgi:hypothetical protein
MLSVLVLILLDSNLSRHKSLYLLQVCYYFPVLLYACYAHIYIISYRSMTGHIAGYNQ